MEAGYSPDDVRLKSELLQPTRTFKARGAFNRVLGGPERGELDPGVGIVVASGDNAGLANAYAAANVGMPATAFVPLTSPAVKVGKLRAARAVVVQEGAEYADAFSLATAHAGQPAALYCHAYDQPEIATGAGTIALELLDQLDGVRTVTVGGGGL